MHNPESPPENETHKLLRDFEINTSLNLGQTTRWTKKKELAKRRICLSG